MWYNDLTKNAMEDHRSAVSKKDNLAYDKAKLKNKWDWMSNKWSLWKALKRKETELGWDHEKGTINFTLGEREKETIYILSLPNYNVGNAPYDYDDVMSENNGFNHNQANMGWQEVWNDFSLVPSPSHSPQFNEQGVGRRGNKQGFGNNAFGSNKSSKTESFGRVGGSTMLMEKLDAMVQVAIERSIKDMELMNLKARTLVNSLAKLVSLPGLIPSTPKFCFACTLIKDPKKRTIHNSLPDDDARLHWLKYLYEEGK
ncbi:hypothetical protein PVK06_024860 [Gossypium arboreum]|uniref:Myb/SANT-like domain-containing protein n=1 Tax=Gossypium arboreum TaxID=29729 RepID=A0ABR0PEU5_GOSAR|nr:hypothetical protein PVK06_024860 [Gossypium arboreum]